MPIVPIFTCESMITEGKTREEIEYASLLETEGRGVSASSEAKMQLATENKRERKGNGYSKAQ